MSDIRSIYFYGNNKSIKLGKNPILNTVFEIFPATKTPLKRILNHNHQWVSNCAFYVPNDVKSEWVKTVTLSILTISIMASFRNAIAQQKGLSPNDEALDEEVENLVPDSLFNSAIELSDLKKSLLEVLPNLMSEYLAQNFGEYESIITNGVAKLFIDNHEFLDKQLDSDAGTDNQISMLNFTDNADELFHTTNYILVRIADSNENLKINFTNSKPHAEHLGRILHTLLGDESFEISKGSIEIPNDEDGQEIFIFEKETNFIDFYNSLLLEVSFFLDHATVLEHIEKYAPINQTLSSLSENLEKNINFVISSFKKTRDLSAYLESRAQIIGLIHEAAQIASIEIQPVAQAKDLKSLIESHHLVTFNDKDTFKQFNLF